VSLDATHDANGGIVASAIPAPFVWAAEKKYDSGASNSEIKIGQTVPHSGPGSLYGVLGRVGEAYFQMLNEKGGTNGRKDSDVIAFENLDVPGSLRAPERRRELLLPSTNPL
jgi:hypothetical protein